LSKARKIYDADWSAQTSHSIAKLSEILRGDALSKSFFIRRRAEPPRVSKEEGRKTNWTRRVAVDMVYCRAVRRPMTHNVNQPTRMSYPPSLNARFIARSKRFSRAAAVFVMLIGALVLSGWLFDIYQLKSAYGSLAMKANTALSLFLASASLWALNLDDKNALARRVGQLCAAMVALVGALTLSQHLFGWNLGIDELLFSEPAGALATVSPGRMGPPASFFRLGSGRRNSRVERGLCAALWLQQRRSLVSHRASESLRLTDISR